ncbi:hypothetical protein HHK36_031793 [Tetracentron sinense]|uniref:Uncharacterized protein n=1 Tax=Tetracentron sinense TaxID=13715 RepID=A0A834Y8G4_TETSI|nr:hypothetical protein HHK36_031793 [Tetracentron sinense]
MNCISGVLFVILLATASLSAADRPDSGRVLAAELNTSKGKGKGNSNNNNNNKKGGFFGPGGGFGIPRVGSHWGNGIIGGGYGGGYGGPTGGYSYSGIIRPTVVCQEKGPCYKKELTCPAKCFTSYSRSGENYGGGGGGGGCTMDCDKKCIAYC